MPGGAGGVKTSLPPSRDEKLAVCGLPGAARNSPIKSIKSPSAAVLHKVNLNKSGPTLLNHNLPTSRACVYLTSNKYERRNGVRRRVVRCSYLRNGSLHARATADSFTTLQSSCHQSSGGSEAGGVRSGAGGANGRKRTTFLNDCVGWYGGATPTHRHVGGTSVAS